LIYRAILACDRKGQPFDAVTLGEWFETNGQSEMVAGGAYLIELASTTPSAANIAAYAEIVRQKATLRNAIQVAMTLVDSAFEPRGAEPGTLLDAAIGDLMALTRSESNHDHTLKQAVTAAFDDMVAAYQNGGTLPGITTGFSRVDKRLGGFHAGDLVVIGARPAMGKTALLVNLAEAACEAGHSIGFISGEQSAKQLGQRAMSRTSGVAAERMRGGDLEDEEWPRLTDAVSKLVGHRFFIHDRSAPTMDEVRRKSRQWRQEFDIQALYVDYAQRIRVPKAQSRVDEVAEVARSLKDLARDLGIPVIALAQVVKNVDTREDKRPSMSDLANSDELVREADLIAMLYRDEVYNENSTARGIAEFNVEKNRHGPCGQFELAWIAETMRFGDLARGDF
jgi:replicative DNA helicase